MVLRPWLANHWHHAVLALIVLTAVGLAVAWVFLVPIYQGPDEPAHFDYALCLLERGWLYQAEDLPGIGYPHWCYYVHPYIWYLVEKSESARIAYRSDVKVPQGYGTVAYYAEIDRDAPSTRDFDCERPPCLVRIYPFGYYALLAAWLSVIRLFTDSIVALFFGARLFSALLLIPTLVLTYAALRELGRSRCFALALTAVIGCFPMTSFIASYIQPDNLAFTLVTLCFYLSLVLRRKPDDLRTLTWLGVALGGLLVTKTHYWACVLVPILGMLVAQQLCLASRSRHWLSTGALVVGPSCVGGLVYLWTTAGIHPLSHLATPPPDSLGSLLDAFNRAFLDYFASTSHTTFWGMFGWLDNPLVIRNSRWNKLIQYTIHIACWVLLALTLVRLEQVSTRLGSLAWRGRWRLALRMALSNPLLNSYFLFMLFMLYLHIRLNNLFGAQGRNWLPFMLPIFLTALDFAPRALSHRTTRRLCTGLVAAGLITYVALGSYYGVKAVNKRYYGSQSEAATVSTPPFPGVDTLNHE